MGYNTIQSSGAESSSAPCRYSDSLNVRAQSRTQDSNACDHVDAGQPDTVRSREASIPDSRA